MNPIEQLRQAISRTHQHGMLLRAEIEKLTAQEKALEAANKERRRRLAHFGTPITMYDSTDIPAFPNRPEAVAGYVGGNWPTFAALVQKFQTAHHVSIAVNRHEDAHCLDIENGDATPLDAPAWIRRQQAKGVSHPILYASLSMMPAVLMALRKAGIQRGEVKLWVAHYDGIAEVPAGFDAKQYDDKALGRNLDVSVCNPSFFS